MAELLLRDVPGWPGYRVSRTGELYGRRGQRIRWHSAASGHMLYVTGGRKLRAAHAVLTAWVGPRPEGALGRHLNDDPTDNRVENLAWGTYADNMADSLRNGRATGSATSAATLTAEQAICVRADPRSSRVVAAELGVSHTTVQYVRRGRRYRNG